MAKKKITTTVVEEIVDDTPFSGTTHIGFVLDCSGSMNRVRDDVIGGFNGWLRDMKRDRSDEALMTMTVFNERLEERHQIVPVERLDELTEATYVPNGGTALYDAVGHAIHTIDRKAASGDRVVFVVYTDGMENSSREYNAQTVASTIREFERRGNWTFTFLGAGLNAWRGNGALRGAMWTANTVRTRDDGIGTRAAFGALSHGIGQYRAAGGMQAQSLYAENAALGQVDASGAIDLTKEPKPKPKAKTPKAASKT